MDVKFHNSSVLKIQRDSNLLPPKKQTTNNLPSICQPRHYLLKGMPSKTKITITNANKSHNSSGREKSITNEESLERKATVYNVEFKKKINSRQYGTNHTISYDDYVKNSTVTKGSLKPKRENPRWRISNFFHRQGSKGSIQLSDSQGKLKTITINSQMSDVAAQSLRMSLNGFSPKMTKLDLSKKQIEYLSKNLHRFQEYRSIQAEHEKGLTIRQYETQQIKNREENRESIKRRSLELARNRYSKKIQSKNREFANASDSGNGDGNGDGNGNFNGNRRGNRRSGRGRRNGVTCTPWAYDDQAEEFADFF